MPDKWPDDIIAHEDIDSLDLVNGRWWKCKFCKNMKDWESWDPVL